MIEAGADSRKGYRLVHSAPTRMSAALVDEDEQQDDDKQFSHNILA